MKNKGEYKVTKEQVIEIENYCKANGVSRKSKIEELGLSESAYYRCRRHIEQTEGSSGQFLSLTSNGVETIQTSTTGRQKHKVSEKTEPMTLELRFTTGAEMRLTGNFTREMLLTVITNV